MIPMRTLTRTPRDSDSTPLRKILSIVGDLLIITAVVMAGYLFWLYTWSGVTAYEDQQSLAAESGFSMTTTKTNKNVAKPMPGQPPSITEPGYGEVVGELHVPRFGSKWSKIIVNGTDDDQLNRHGLGHYQGTAMPGQIGLFSLAGHRAGYGEPLAYIDTLKNGDPIVVKADNKWFVYTYYDHKIVNSGEKHALDPVPFQPGAQPHDRLMALTSCEPRYSWTSAPYRWVSYARFKYWANADDGVPKELAETNDDGTATGWNIGSGPIIRFLSRLPSAPIMIGILLAAYVVIFMMSAFRKGWNLRRGEGILSLFNSLQPGGRLSRTVLDLIVILIVFVLLLQWGYPFLAAHVPLLGSMAPTAV